MVEGNMRRVRGILENYKGIIEEIELLKVELKHEEEDYDITAYELKESTCKTNVINKIVEKKSEKRQDKISKIQHMINILAYKKERIEKEIMRLSNEEQEVLRLRFLEDNLTFKQIATKMGISTTWCQKIERKCLAKLEELISVY